MTFVQDIHYSLFGPPPFLQVGPDVNGDMHILEIRPINLTTVTVLSITFILFLVFMWFYLSPLWFPDGLRLYLNLHRIGSGSESTQLLIYHQDTLASTASSFSYVANHPIVPPPPAYASRPSTPAPEYPPTPSSLSHVDSGLNHNKRFTPMSKALSERPMFIADPPHPATRSVSDSAAVFRPPSVYIAASSRGTTWTDADLSRDLAARRARREFYLDLGATSLGRRF